MIEKPRYILLPLTGILKDKSLWLEGQVLHQRNHHTPVPADESHWKNIIRIISAYLPGNMKSGLLEINISGMHRTLALTHNGFFKIKIDNLALNETVPKPHYHFIRNHHRHIVHIPDHYFREIYSYNGFTTGIISDIDDTILVSHAKSYIKRARQLLIKNGYRRKAVNQMSEMYRMLHEKNIRMFYVSNSEANLYPMIHLFLIHHGFPEGPVFLKPYKKWKDFLQHRERASSTKHKKEKIQNILSVFHDKNFILIGDDSQKDPEVYSEIARLYPKRVKAIFIRKTNSRVQPKTDKIPERLSSESPVSFTFFENPVNLKAIFDLTDI